MPTKYPRGECLTCRHKVVKWKMPVISDENGGHRHLLCWECAQRLFNYLLDLKIVSPPDKEFLLPKLLPKHDAMNKAALKSLGVFNRSLKKHLVK